MPIDTLYTFAFGTIGLTALAFLVLAVFIAVAKE